MIYSSRLKKILHYCLTHREQYVRLDELADLLKISKRTIFRELKDVDQDLESYSLRIVNTSGKGLRIDGEEVMKDELLKELQTQGIEYINKEERQHLLTFELLHNAEVTKLIHYANLFQVSQASISNDLDVIEPWFHSHKLELLRKPGLGVEVLGKEQDMRSAMTALLHETLQKQSYDEVNYLDSATLLNQIFIKDDQNSIMRLLNQDILERILHVFHTYQHELSLDRYAQSSYIGLMIHLVIAIDRILKKEEIADNEQVVSMVEEDVSFLQAKKMAHLLEIEFDIDMPKTEIAFIALHIQGAKITSVEYSEVKQEQLTNIMGLIQRMLNSYDEHIRLQLVQDDELIHGLLTHLEPTIIRLENHLPIYNPLLEQIQQMYMDLYKQTQHACKRIEEEYACEVSDDEVGFITMHVGASLERMKRQIDHLREVTIGVVCASGIGVSALLSARIQKLFAYGVRMRVLSMDDILRNDYEDCELLVSTFSLTNTNVEVFCVSPLLNGDDIIRIRSAVEELQKRKRPQKSTPERDFIQQLHGIQNLSNHILELLEHISLSTIEDEVSDADMITQIAKDHGDRYESCECIQKDILKREQMGSVVMQDYGFAMYHAKSDGVKHCVLHFYYPQGGCFTKGKLKDLKFVVAMLSDTHGDVQKQMMLGTISRALIDDDKFYRAICEQNESVIHDEMIHVLHEYLISYLEDHL